ncbi:MAG: RNA polymerase sigma factor [Planctomycetota bacterium]
MLTTEALAETRCEMSDVPNSSSSEHFWKLLERFRADLVNQAFVILGNQEDAEDVAQETLSKACLQQQQLRDISKLNAWLRSINRHGAFKLQRREAREERLSTAQANALEAPKKTTLSTTAVNTLDYILRVVDELPQLHREVLVLRYWEKLSNEEIAARLEIPLGTVCSRMARANKVLIQKVKAMLRREN